MTYRSPADLDRGRRARRRGVGHRRAAGRRDPAHRAAGDARPSASTCGCRGPYRGPRHLLVDGAAGVLGERHDEVDDLVRARHLPSPQLIGTPEHRSIDLNALSDGGVRIVGRLSGGHATASPSSPAALANVCRLADLKMDRLLDRFDEWADDDETVRRRAPPERFAPTRVPPSPDARARPAARRDRHGRLGDRLPARPLVGRPAGVRPQAADPPRRRRRARRAGRLPARRRTCCGAAARASSTAPKPTRPISRPICTRTSLPSNDARPSRRRPDGRTRRSGSVVRQKCVGQQHVDQCFGDARGVLLGRPARLEHEADVSAPAEHEDEQVDHSRSVEPGA